MPIETCRAARRLAWLAGDVLKIRGEVVDDNLRHAFPADVGGGGALPGGWGTRSW
jgi:lauroyl/myristoyl acyltransferase